MSARFAVVGLLAVGLISSAVRLEAPGPFSAGQGPLRMTAQSLKGVQIGQAETSGKCAAGYFWTCSKFGCWCQKAGQVYHAE